jgi:ATP-binding cassette subfamily C protein CydCD
MHFEPRLWIFTEGVRLRIAGAVLIGLAAVALGVARLALLGWLIGAVFAGRDLAALALPAAAIAGVMVLRGLFEQWRTWTRTAPRRASRCACAARSTTRSRRWGRARSGASARVRWRWR